MSNLSRCGLAVMMVLLAAGACVARAAECPRFVPPWFSDAMAYHNDFEGALADADVNLPQIKPEGPESTAEGLFGKALQLTDKSLIIRSEAVSPHRPLTLSFWWALTYDMVLESGYSLFQLDGKGMIALFSRGKGEWCALQRPAGVFQVYYFQGIQNVNGIYDSDLLSHYDLRKGVWHHTAVVFRRATTAQVYMDGQPVCEVTISGREWTAGDELRNLTIGGGLSVDELLILDRAVEGEMIADYVRGVQRLREYYAGGG